MTSRQPFEIIYDPIVIDHLGVIEPKYHSLIRETINEQLLYEPELETRNRKPLRPVLNLDVTWELRCGPHNRIRIFYRTDMINSIIYIRAIAIKKGNQLFIGSQELEL